MARKQEVVVTLLDDIDGSTAADTVSFGIDGVSYEIDLSRKNAKALRSDFDKWAAHARKARANTRGARGTRRRASAARPTSDAAAIRQWAAAHGVEVPSRGRIPKAVVEQYRAS